MTPSSPLPPPSFPPPPSDPGDDLVTVTTCGSEFEAATKVTVLEEAGIEAFAFGHAQAALPLNTLKVLRVPVQVRAADAERAKAVLADNAIDSARMDWDSVDVGERDDHLPLRAVGRMPWPARIGFVLAMIVLITTLLGIAVGAMIAIFSKW